MMMLLSQMKIQQQQMRQQQLYLAQRSSMDDFISSNGE
jgi:hypothetical protein